MKINCWVLQRDGVGIYKIGLESYDRTQRIDENMIGIPHGNKIYSFIYFPRGKNNNKYKNMLLDFVKHEVDKEFYSLEKEKNRFDKFVDLERTFDKLYYEN